MTDEIARFEDALAASASTPYVLKLYVLGATPISRRAITAIHRVCEQELSGRYALEVVDVFQRPEIAGERGLVAAPTLVREQPLPERRLVGDLTHHQRVLDGLDLPRR